MLIESRAKLMMIEETRGTKMQEQLAIHAVTTLRSQHPELLKEVWNVEGGAAVIYRIDRNRSQPFDP